MKGVNRGRRWQARINGAYRGEGRGSEKWEGKVEESGSEGRVKMTRDDRGKMGYSYTQ